MRLDRDDRGFYQVKPSATVDGEPSSDLTFAAAFFDGVFHEPHQTTEDGYLRWLLAGPDFVAKPDDTADFIRVTRGGRPRIECTSDPEVDYEYGPRIRMPVS